MKKKLMKMLMTGLVLMGLSCISAQAETVDEPGKTPTGISMMSELEPASDAAAYTESNPLLPKLKSGNHVKWIDRVELTENALGFYRSLEEGADNDGYKDFLIDPFEPNIGEYFTMEYEDENGKEQTGIATGRKLYDLSVKGADYDAVLAQIYLDYEKVYYQYQSAVEAFLMDHPELFWLNKSFQIIVPELWVEELDNGYHMTGSVYLILLIDNGESEAAFDMRYEKYNSVSIRQTIKTMDDKINTILKAVEGADDLTKVAYFHEWLIKNNVLNTYFNTVSDEVYVDELLKYPEAFEYVSALSGTVGKGAPTETAYANAFKVLCDRAGIPCTLVRGRAGNSSEYVGQIWNMVEIDGKWYAVDAAWDDKTDKPSAGVVSGDESEQLFLVGSDTMVTVMGETLAFGDAYELVNQVYSSEGVAYTNGPVLEKNRRITAIESITLTASEDKIMHGYMEYPTITAEVKVKEGQTGEPTHTWYLVDPQNQAVKIESETPDSVAFPEVEEPGTYKIRLVVELAGDIRTVEIKIDIIGFTDVTEDDWFNDSVNWAIENGITYGYTATAFAPYMQCTRAQVVSFLWRFYGCPEPQLTDITELGFHDIPENSYYCKAVLWAMESDIVKGYTSTTFAPDEGITRAELATFLWRAAGKPSYATDNAEDEMIKFKDITNNVWYYQAVYWAVDNNITKGYTPDMFAPSASATRSEIVTFLYRAENVLLGTES